MVMELLAHKAAPERDEAALVRVDRATAELRRGGLVVVTDGADSAALLGAAETVSDEGLDRLRGQSGGAVALVLTRQRSAVLGIRAASGPVVSLGLPPDLSAEEIRRLADPTAESFPTPAGLEPGAAGATTLAAAGIELAKLARLLPAVLVAPLARRDGAGVVGWAARRDLLWVTVREIAGYETAAARTLQPVGEARVPLIGAEAARIVAFRPSDGGAEHLAIIIGEPSPAGPVLTRLHSECFTGDLLGSLRCDCGDQLRGAIAEIARQGSGVLLYLAQEGRGIGLVNKLRAYRLQDRGADTFEANEQLGFDADERVYLPAAEMLRRLGFLQVRLMTNNPQKVAALTRCGIAVAERVAHVFPSNDHNERYLRTKASRLGHMF